MSRDDSVGQMYSDEDKRGLFNFSSKAGNGKSVPRRNHILPGVEVHCHVGGSCQTLISESYLHLMRAHYPAGVFVCVSACVGK